MHRDQQLTCDERLHYHAPDFRVEQLTLITLGGISGAGDSGAPGSERGGGEDDPFNPANYNDGDDDWTG